MPSQYRSLTFWSLVLLPPLLYFVLVVYATPNIPHWDDYDVFLSYLNLSNDARLHQLLAQHNEHRIVFNRVIVEAIYQTFGNVDFRLLVFLGNMSLVLLLVVFYYLFSKTDIPIKFFLLVPYILFFGRMSENAAWATGALQNFSVLLFSILALLLFNNRSLISFATSMVLAIVASFTSGSGLLILVVMIVWSVLNVINTQRLQPERGDISQTFLSTPSTIRLVVTLGVAALVFYIYFHNYARPSIHPDISLALLSPLRTLRYGLVFLASYIPNKTVATLGGILCIALFAYITHRKYYDKNPVVYFFTAYLMLNSFAAAMTRSAFGINQAMSSRYTIISSLVFICLYLATLEISTLSQFSILRLYYLSFIVVIVIGTFSFREEVSFLLQQRDRLIQGGIEWKSSRTGLDYPDQSRATLIMEQANKKGYYRLPDVPVP